MSVQPISEKSILRRLEQIATQIDGEIVIMSMKRGQLYGLDEIGSDIWQRLESPKSLKALVGELEKDYRGDPVAIEQDTRTLLQKLHHEGLIEVSEPFAKTAE